MRICNKKNVFLCQHRGMEQLVARRAHNPKVIGSSPVPATTTSINACKYRRFDVKRHIKPVQMRDRFYLWI
jgi:hypothetical protein